MYDRIAWDCLTNVPLSCVRSFNPCGVVNEGKQNTQPAPCSPTMRPLFHVSIPRARPSRAPFLGLLCFLTVVDALQLRMPTSCGFPPVADAHHLQMTTSCGRPPAADAHHPQPANVRDWTSWHSDFKDWDLVESVLQSDDADEYVSFLQQSAGWKSISTAVALCYKAGATHVLLTDVWSVRDPDWGYIQLAVHWCAKRWNRRSDDMIELRDHGKDIEDRGSALVGNRVVITHFEFDDLAWAESPLACIGGNYVGSLLPASLWISRCGTVRPARSFANLIHEIGEYEEKSGHHNEVQNTICSSS